MRAEEFTIEMAGKIHGGVRKALMNKGYRYLGGGIDKQAYLEPSTGQVLVVFGYRKDVGDFSPDQRMFINWINYCNQNVNNPNLPRFSGFESFEFQGQKYIQARMEALQELPDTVKFVVGILDQAIAKTGLSNYDRAFEKIAQYADDEGFMSIKDEKYDVSRAVELLGGAESAKNLLKTVHAVMKFAKKNNYSMDLHSGNYMARPNGTIVVNDPFVIWERNL